VSDVAVTADGVDQEVRALALVQQRLAARTQAGNARKAMPTPRASRGMACEPRALTITGHEAIRAWMKAPSVIPAPAGRAPDFVSHHLTTCHANFTSPTSNVGQIRELFPQEIGDLLPLVVRRFGRLRHEDRLNHGDHGRPLCGRRLGQRLGHPVHLAVLPARY